MERTEIPDGFTVHEIRSTTVRVLRVMPPSLTLGHNRLRGPF
jgi:hypothetical protein